MQSGSFILQNFKLENNDTSIGHTGTHIGFGKLYIILAYQTVPHNFELSSEIINQCFASFMV